MRLSSAVRFVIHFACSFFTTLPRVIYRCTISILVDPRGSQEFVHQVLNAVDLEKDDPVLGSKDIEDVIKGHADIQIDGPYFSRQGSDTRILMELASLAYLVRMERPLLIFEIGTYIGRTTRLFLRNSPPDARIVTLDLSPEHVSHSIGADYKCAPGQERVVQVHGDSMTFDFSNWHKQCDFVWVDASHDYDNVVSDTRNALDLCRAGGWIGWHDYRHSAWWSGVTRAVRELEPRYPDLFHLRGTTIALLKLV